MTCSHLLGYALRANHNLPYINNSLGNFRGIPKYPQSLISASWGLLLIVWQVLFVWAYVRGEVYWGYERNLNRGAIYRQNTFEYCRIPLNWCPLDYTCLCDCYYYNLDHHQSMSLHRIHSCWVRNYLKFLNPGKSVHNHTERHHLSIYKTHMWLTSHLPWGQWCYPWRFLPKD